MTDLAASPRAYHELSAAEADLLLDRLRQLDPGGRVLLRGATVVTMDPRIPDLANGDVLIRGSVIEAVGADLRNEAGRSDVVVIDLKGMIVIPGFIDGHRHCW